MTGGLGNMEDFIDIMHFSSPDTQYHPNSILKNIHVTPLTETCCRFPISLCYKRKAAG